MIDTTNKDNLNTPTQAQVNKAVAHNLSSKCILSKDQSRNDFTTENYLATLLFM